MNKTSADRIQSAAKFLRTPTAQAARGYLAEPLELALKVLDAFADGKPHFPDEVAENLGIHSETVKQVLRALDKGGYGFVFSPSGGLKPEPGRPPKTAQIKKVVKRR